jgi:uncharacterized protein affecting Mg2+/Co2+ transport
MRVFSKLHLLIVSCILAGSYTVHAASKSQEAKLKNATVYFQGAELTHTLTSTLSKGENELVISGLSPNIDKNSLRITTTNGSVINSFEFSVDYMTDAAPSASVKRWQDSLDICTAKLEEVNDLLKTNENVLQLLQVDSNSSDKDGAINFAELIKYAEYFKTKSVALLSEQRETKAKKKRLDETIKRLRAQIAQESGKNNKASGVLKLQLMSPLANASDIKIVYFTPTANWTPYYDINVVSVNKPIKIITKAKVSQTTGLNWDKVNLTLSSATPAYGKVAPLFKAWFLDYQDLRQVAMGRLGLAPEILAQNSFSYRMDEREMVSSFSGTSTTQKERKKMSEPIYVVDGQIVTRDYTEQIDPNMVKSTSVLKRDDAVAQFGNQASSGAIVITLKNSMDDYVTQSDNEFSQTYVIDLPYTIAGNGKAQNIELQTKDVPASFKYYTVPKLAAEAYLLAEISDWEKLGLLTGKANITYDGTYMGETLIDTQSTLDKLSLTLGVDKRISVKREKLQDFSSRKFLGNDVKQVFTYQITIKNNQNQPISMTAKDQYPISTKKEIEVEVLKETTTASHINEEVGVLVWDFDLKPGESKTFKTSYSVKYPKGKTLNL